MTERDLAKLRGCDHRLIVAIDRVLRYMGAIGYPMMVTSGARTTGEQIILYSKGRTAPGAIVTYADGLHVKSNHQSGKACDCAFLVQGEPSWAESLPWIEYGEQVEREKLRWGGRFTHPDRPHAELPEDDQKLLEV